MADEDFIEDDETEDRMSLSRKEYDDLQAKSRLTKKERDELDASRAAARELAFVKAGVDTDSKLGQLLMRSYDGDLTVAAIKAEATEIGLFQPVSEAEGVTDEERASTDERQAAATGAPADTAPPVNPAKAAVKAGQDAFDAGASEEAAIATAIHELASHEEAWARVEA